jgi:type II secretory pathway component PulC
MRRVFLSALFVGVLVLVGVCAMGQDGRMPVRRESYLGIDIEYVGRFISKSGSFAVLRVNNKEARYRQGDHIGNGVSVFRVSQDLLVEKDGMLFVIPFSSSRNFRRVAEGSDGVIVKPSPSTRCINMNIQGDFVLSCIGDIVNLLRDRPEGILVYGNIPEGNLFSLAFRKDDIITQVNRQLVNDRRKLFQMMQKIRDDDEPVEVFYLRENKKESVIFNRLRRS